MGIAFLAAILRLTYVAAVGFCPTLHADMMRRQRSHFEPYVFTEANGTKHTPYISLAGSVATVTVGNARAYHPMSAASSQNSGAHFITHVYVLDQDGSMVGMKALDPSNTTRAVATFNVPVSATQLVAYEWCNLHGLWMGPVVKVAAGTGSQQTCTKPVLSSGAYTSLVADFNRRQQSEFQASVPFDENRSKKHTPYLYVHSGTATVEVGTTSAGFHPMLASSDEAQVHFITHIYVLDEKGNVVFMTGLDPSNMSKARAVFPIPAHVTSLTPYEWCNKHGLYAGRTVFTSKTHISSNSAQRVKMITGALALVSLMDLFP